MVNMVFLLIFLVSRSYSLLGHNDFMKYQFAKVANRALRFGHGEITPHIIGVCSLKEERINPGISFACCKNLGNNTVRVDLTSKVVNP